MPRSNTSHSYGSVAKTFHWLVALLILTVIPLGIIANDMAYDTSRQLAQKALLFSIHKTLGITIFFVALARIFWAITQPKPGLLNADNRLEATLAETAHWLLYGSLVLVPLSGWIGHAATTGFAPIWWPFGQSLPFVPKDEGIAHLFSGLHQVLERVLIVTLVLHIAGALKHHIIDRDATLRRMLPGHVDAPAPPPQHKTALPLIAALIVWAAALAAGAFTGFFQRDTATVPGAALEDVPSQWIVQDGAITISVTQFGSTVTGTFADWTAAITFDPTERDDRAGSVDVTIAIPSLSLGSVTAQALGPDFFDAATFPTARFTADILPMPDDRYVAEGTLTIRGATVPVTLNFDLAISDGVAEMRGDLMLDRRDFGIGDSMSDEKSLGFPVKVDATLRASQADT